MVDVDKVISVFLEGMIIYLADNREKMKKKQEKDKFFILYFRFWGFSTREKGKINPKQYSLRFLEDFRYGISKITKLLFEKMIEGFDIGLSHKNCSIGGFY